MKKNQIKEKVSKFHDKNYKKLLLIPSLIFILCIVYMGFFYVSNNDFIYRDISLTGGTTITIFDKIDINDLRNEISNELDSLSVREISDLVTREQIAIIIETKTDAQEARKIVGNYLGYELTEENSNIEFTGTSLSEGFFKQLVLAILTAFLFMGFVVFLLFGKKIKLKFLLGFFSVFPMLSFFVFGFSINIVIILSILFLIVNLFIYVKESMPSFAIILSAFSDIFMTLTVLNILRVQMSTAGIVALLMLIGYSVDTDILLTNRVLKRKEGSLNSRIFSAFSTGITMNLTTLLALLIALIVIGSFSVTLSKIFLVLVIGLGFDLMNTWITNASILKWSVLKNE